MQYSEINLNNLNETIHEVAQKNITKINPVLVYDKKINNFSIESWTNNISDSTLVITFLGENTQLEELAEIKKGIYIEDNFDFELFLNMARA